MAALSPTLQVILFSVGTICRHAIACVEEVWGGKIICLLYLFFSFLVDSFTFSATCLLFFCHVALLKTRVLCHKHMGNIHVMGPWGFDAVYITVQIEFDNFIHV